MSRPAPEPSKSSKHLVVLAQGLSGEDLASDFSATDLAAVANHHTVTLVRDDRDPAQRILDTLPVEEIRDGGVSVDRRDLLLRPGWRSDEQSLALLARRPIGPADVTLLESRSVLLAAARSGCGTRAVSAARTQMWDHLRSTITRVQRGTPPHLWLMALGEPVGVAHTIDIQQLVSRLVGRQLSRDVSVAVRAHRAIVTATSVRAIDQLLARLPGSPLAEARIGEHDNGLVLLAPPSIAFGRRRLFARTSHPQERASVVLLPELPRTVAQLDIPGVVARLTMMAMHGARSTELHLAKAPTTAASTPGQLLPIVEPETGRPVQQAADDESLLRER